MMSTGALCEKQVNDTQSLGCPEAPRTGWSPER
jgi:hypothetical protein